MPTLGLKPSESIKSLAKIHNDYSQRFFHNHMGAARKVQHKPLLILEITVLFAG
jgi:hypothetical protein